ncbi:MAG: FAD-dependent oxidoreductase [Alphaproteobacteria bacterium]
MTVPEFPTLFSPLALRHKTLKNRIVFGAHTANMAEDGLPGERHLAYYRERARGGAAMIVVEPTPAHRTGVLTRGNFRHEDDSVIAPFRRVTDACHEHGTVMIHQIYHVGAHGDLDNSWQPYWSPSGTVSHHDQYGSHAMSQAEVEEMIDSFIAAARRDHQAGFDGVDLFAGYNALMDQFWSPLTNKRSDQWGGSLENRLRFTVRIIEGIRAVAGQDFIIGLTVSGAEPYPGGLSLADKQEIAAWLDARGLVDYFSCGTGSYLNDFSKIVPSSIFDMFLGADDAAAYKAAVRLARVTAEARIKTPANAEQVLSDGKSDLVSIVRGQIADPHLANKALQGHGDDIRGCISCNQLCIGRRMRDYWISCLVNPSVGREAEMDGDSYPTADRPKRVLVVGGGPAGMEAARTAAERGHQVTLVEKSDRLGGQFRLAGHQPYRGEIRDLIESWYPRQLQKLQVQVRLNTEMDEAAVRDFAADKVVIATGARAAGTGFQRALPHIERLPGADADTVLSVAGVLAEKAVPGKRVVLLDDVKGSWPATGTALYLAERGHDVTIITAEAGFAGALGGSLSAGVRGRMRQLGIGAVTDAALLAWTAEGAKVKDLLSGEERVIAADSLVLATTNTPEDELARTLDGDQTVDSTAIGDCVATRSAAMAIYEGRRLGLAL